MIATMSKYRIEEIIDKTGYFDLNEQNTSFETMQSLEKLIHEKKVIRDPSSVLRYVRPMKTITITIVAKIHSWETPIDYDSVREALEFNGRVVGPCTEGYRKKCERVEALRSKLFSSHIKVEET